MWCGDFLVSVVWSKSHHTTLDPILMVFPNFTGALTQWNATGTTGIFGGDTFFESAAGANAAVGGGGVPWDWGMGWGWAGWTPESAITASAASAFCGSCALEQHQAALAASSGNSYQSLTGSSSGGRHEFYSFDDDHELGEIGDTADVACDFGGDFGGF